MNKKYLAQCGDTDQCQILLCIGTKNAEKADAKADEILNDILNCISITKKSKDIRESPQFLKSIQRLENKIWKMLK